MSGPPRIREAGSDVPDELRELFRGAEPPEPLTPAARAALSARIAAIAAAPTPLLVKTLPWLLGAVVVAAGAVALRSQVGQAEQGTEPVARPPVAAVTPPAVSDEPAEPPPASAAQSTEPPPRAEAHARALTAAPKASTTAEDSLKGEAQLLNQAHRALASDPPAALASAREHARRYPGGQLAAERELLLVQALVKLGRRGEAEARGRQLRKAVPNSIYEERLDTVLRGQ